MNQELIDMAKEAGIDCWQWEKLSDDDDVFGYEFCGIHENLEAFAALVAAAAVAAEREACAKVCESYLSESPHSWGGTTMAAAIRARGEAK
jgi:hypothetical protein